MVSLSRAALVAFLAFGLHIQTGLADPPLFQDVFERAFPNVSFERPVALMPDPAGSHWLFVVEQEGTIRTFIGEDATEETFLVLDISDRVLGYDVDVESGLLGLALHPQFADNGYIFTYYLTDVTGQPTARLSRFTTSGTPAVADLDSELVLIELQRDHLKHNGGDLHFSEEGYLFASFGDGLCCGDPADHGQDRTNLFSTIIRIDVDSPQNGLPYGIPADNPFAGNTEGWREEIWAYGLRNPWRFSIHPETGEVWVGDVGEITYEEINRIVPGGNYGWSIMEGPECFEWPPGSGQGTNCDTGGLIPPAWYFERDDAVAITGGYFYQGGRRPELMGKYVFADWGLKNFWIASLNEGGTEILEVETIVREHGPHPSAFGVDADGELYVLDYFQGRLFHFKATTSGTPPEPQPPSATQILLDGPNPVRHSTRFEVELSEVGQSSVVLFDVAGRYVRSLLEADLRAPDSYQIDLDARGLAGGAYMVALVVDGVLVHHVPITIIP